MKYNFTEETFLNYCKMITNNNANFEPISSNSNLKVDEKVQRLDVEELDTNNTSKSIQIPDEILKIPIAYYIGKTGIEKSY